MLSDQEIEMIKKYAIAIGINIGCNVQAARNTIMEIDEMCMNCNKHHLCKAYYDEQFSKDELKEIRQLQDSIENSLGEPAECLSTSEETIDEFNFFGYTNKGKEEFLKFKRKAQEMQQFKMFPRQLGKTEIQINMPESATYTFNCYYSSVSDILDNMMEDYIKLPSTDYSKFKSPKFKFGMAP